jgi:hypothetical protein
VKEAEAVLGFSIPPRVDPMELLEPREQVLDLPSATIAAQGAAILLATAGARALPPGAMSSMARSSRRRCCRGGAVETLVGDQFGRELFDKGFVERLLDEGAVVSGAICDANGVI